MSVLGRLRLMALSPALMLVGGCYTWQVQAVSPKEALATAPNAVRVVGHDGRSHELVGPHLFADSVVGAAFHQGDATRVAIAMKDVQTVAVLRKNGLRSTVAGLVGGGLFYAGLAVLWKSVCEQGCW